MEKVLDRELRELTACINEDPNCPEVCFLHQAIQELTERKTAALTHDVAVEKEITEPKVNTDNHLIVHLLMVKKFNLQ